MARGSYRHLVTLEGPTSTADGDGGYTQAWASLSPATMYAAIRPATARDLEHLVTNTVEGMASHIVEMDYHSGVTIQTRITFGARVFQVTGIQNPEERNISLALACVERLS